MTIVADASALVALAKREPGWEAFERIFASEPDFLIAPINLVEAGLSLTAGGSIMTPVQFWEWTAELGVREATTPLAAEALEAYRVYGKGFHRARLNLGDCFAYALAKQENAPLLYKGDDFALTDIASAL